MAPYQESQRDENGNSRLAYIFPLKVLTSTRAISRDNQQTTTQYEHSVWVAEYAKRLAKDICQLCLKPAPFENGKGDPYLETHHIVWLSKDGEDTIANTVALCPNCHKKMHIVDDKKDVKTLQQRAKQWVDVA